MIEQDSQIIQAVTFAKEVHGTQKRKGAAGEPYFSHLEEVATLLAEHTRHRPDPVLIVAGLLHDTIEDTSICYEDLVEAFGDDVADVVRELTDDKGLSKEQRKRQQVETASLKSERAKMIKIADKISNLRAVISSPPEGWSLARKCEYYEWSRLVVAGCRGVNTSLEATFDRVYEEGVGRLNAPERVWSQVRRNPYAQSARDGMAP